MSNQVYQRPLSEGHIISAVKDFDVYQINPVKVSRRNGINYVFDGQHTIEIVASRSGSRDTPVWCIGTLSITHFFCHCHDPIISCFDVGSVSSKRIIKTQNTPQ